MIVELLRITDKPEELIEMAARKCYGGKFNGVVNGDFIKSIIKKKHFSVLEHSVATFDISQVSRTLTHQFVRSRHHSFSQESQRFCKVNNLDYVIPESISSNPELVKRYIDSMSVVKSTYIDLVEAGVPREDARFLLPNATHTTVMATANMSAWRHFLSLRCAPDAQWEIRDMAYQMLDILSGHCPSVFYDMKRRV